MIRKSQILAGVILCIAMLLTMQFPVLKVFADSEFLSENPIQPIEEERYSEDIYLMAEQMSNEHMDAEIRNNGYADFSFNLSTYSIQNPEYIDDDIAGTWTEQEWTLIPPEIIMPLIIPAGVGDIKVDRNRGISEIVETAKILTHTGFNLQKTMSYDELPLLTAPYGAGVLASEDLNDALNALKMVRYLAGLPYDLTLSNTLNNSAQHKAVLISVSEFTHRPPQPDDMSDEFFEAAANPGRESIAASISNLSHSILRFVADPGAANIAQTGHRMMMLSPGTQSFGMGYVYNDSNSLPYTHYIAIHSRYSEIMPDTYIAWPNSGDFPIEYFVLNTNIYNPVPYPWSLSLGSAYEKPNYEDIILTLKRNRDNKIWTFDSSTPNLANGGYNDPSLDHLTVSGRNIVFRPNANALGFIGDEDIFTVTLTGIKTATGEDTVLEYSVNFFSLEKEKNRSRVEIIVKKGVIPVQNASVFIDGQTLTTDANGTISLRVNNNKTYDYIVSKNGYDVNMGTIAVGADNVTIDVQLQPLVTATGDVNGDGTVNMQDVLLIYQHFRGKVALEGDGLIAADVNGDGLVNMQDVLLVYHFYALYFDY